MYVHLELMEKKSLCLKHVREPLMSEVDSEVDKSEVLSSKLQKLDERFDFNVTSDDLTHFMEGETPANTERSTTWAVKIYSAIGEGPGMQLQLQICVLKISLIMKITVLFISGSVNS